MTADADGLRRLADVVDALGETPIDVDGAQLLSGGGDDVIRGQLTVTVRDDVDLELVATETPDLEDDSIDTQPARATTDPEAEPPDGEDSAGGDDDSLDHTSTEDLQLAYDDADGTISEAAERFDVGYGAVYRRMVEHGVHETESNDSDDSGTSTEADTNRESESEAHDIGLEEDAADDVANRDGDDVQDAGSETDTEAITVDAVDDVEEPDESDIELPEGVTAADVKALANELETVGDVGHEIGVTRGRARSITVTLGCYGDLKDLPRGGR